MNQQKATSAENIRINQGYSIIDSVIVGQREFVLGENLRAPAPYVTWMRNLQSDARSGGENFYWGHYFADKATAQRDFQQRIDNWIKEQQPASVLEQLNHCQDEISRQNHANHTPKPTKATDKSR